MMTIEDTFVQHALSGSPLRQVLVVDAHCHLGPCRRLRIIDSSVESLVRVMDRLGIDHAAPSSLAASIGGIVERGNDQVIDAVQRYPERIHGYMAVNPQYPHAAARELERCLGAGLRAVKVHSGQGTPYGDPCYELVWAFAEEHALPVLAHTWGAELAQLEPLFDRYPRIHWILAHGGVADRDAYVRAGVGHANVFVDTTYSACPRGLVEYLANSGLEDKLLWGTDAGFMSAAPQLGKILTAQITPSQKLKILGTNARRALRLA
jgi:predicted TIM-barrel fold metal-dependent hydrolase